MDIIRLRLVNIILIMSSLTLFLLLVLHASYHESTHAGYLRDITKITRLPGIAYGSSYLEARIPIFEDDSNRLYPQMPMTGSRDYVYAK